MKEIVNQGSVARLYQTGKLSPEGLRRYQHGQPLTAESFKDRSSATYAYQHGFLTNAGLHEYQKGHLGGRRTSWDGFGNEGS